MIGRATKDDASYGVAWCERTVRARLLNRIDVSVEVLMERGSSSAGREVKWIFPVEIAGGDCLVNSE